MFWVKTFDVRGEFLVAICDEDLLGKEFGSFRVEREFYQGKLVDGDAAIELLSRATIANLVGKEIVKLAMENGFVDEANVMCIGGIPHTQVIKI
jgi:hypothetical protein